MSNNFTGTTTANYRGTTYRLPVKLPQGIITPPGRVQPSVCPVTIDWVVYWQAAGNPANMGVFVNLQAASVQASILDRIASVKIDNTGSQNSVYVLFEDTGDVINCPPNCSVTYPCLTNLLNAKIIATGLTAGFIPTTKIYFYNIELPPSVDYEVSQSVSLWKASPSITRGNTILNTNFGVPALADQFQSPSLPLSPIGNTVGLWGTPYPSGFIYVNSFILTVGNMYSNGTSEFGQIVVESTGISGILFQPAFQSPATIAERTYNQIITQNHGMNLKLDATQTWRMRVAAVIFSGFSQVYTAFTKSDF